MGWLSTVVDFIFNGFVLATLLFFLWRPLAKNYRQALDKFIALSNTFLLFGSTLFLAMLALSLTQLFTSAKDPGDWEAYALGNRMFGPYWFAYWGSGLCRGIMPQILWKRKFRNSLWIALLLVPFLLVDYWMPKVVMLMSRDYLPSSWTWYPMHYVGVFLNAMIYLAAVTVVFILTKNRKAI